MLSLIETTTIPIQMSSPQVILQIDAFLRKLVVLFSIECDSTWVGRDPTAFENDGLNFQQDESVDDWYRRMAVRTYEKLKEIPEDVELAGDDDDIPHGADDENFIVAEDVSDSTERVVEAFPFRSIYTLKFERMHYFFIMIVEFVKNVVRPVLRQEHNLSRRTLLGTRYLWYNRFHDPNPEETT